MRALFMVKAKVGDVETIAFALETAAATKRAGHDVVFFLASGAVLLANPQKYLTKGDFQGMTAPRTNAQWLFDQGVRFYVESTYGTKSGIAQSPQVVFATFDQLAVELPGFDQVLVF